MGDTIVCVCAASGGGRGGRCRIGNCCHKCGSVRVCMRACACVRACVCMPVCVD